MLYESETAEQEHLRDIVKKLQAALTAIEDKVSDSYRDVIEAKKYLWVNMAQLDPAERAANRVDISLSIDAGEKAVAKRQRISKLVSSPYFGRVDFKALDHAEADACYIGVHAFSEEESQRNLIYDWRSPIASLFYDFHVGEAHYEAPMGRMKGKITTKRQYKIRDGIMDYMIESSMNINDDVLQKELSSSSDEKMKNIVATIQQEQNRIIRNETAGELIIQGVAGSGKTSVALHRVAYLLYRFKETLTSGNVLIISPNKVFSDYISNVLPELGEEMIMEASMEELAAQELGSICKFQTFYEQAAVLLEDRDEAFAKRIRYKARLDLIGELESFAKHAETHYFEPEDIMLEQAAISRKAILDSYQATAGMPLEQRLAKTAAVIGGQSRTEDGERLKPAAIKKIKTAVKKMFKIPSMLNLYKEFYNFIGRPEMYKPIAKNIIEFADVFPLIYLKILIEGAEPVQLVKHLLVDEMQDYTPVQYAVLAKRFPCKKTILGDASQSVNPYSSTSLTAIKEVFPRAESMELLKSYRSTFEITNFALRIKPNQELVPIERHGDVPQVIRYGSLKEELDGIRELCRQFLNSKLHSLGIVCKTKTQAEQIVHAIKELHADVHLLDFTSEVFHEGITVTFAHMAKGLEFDQVIVPFADRETYQTELDRSLLYVACTRAMHSLYLTYSDEIAPFLHV
ncbi:HelD family protein [Paenibacillus azoreducens]|uniref:Helicase n=1 Tax=Paenibacillus azoreducens TaxID=116718 RepID=A0A919YM97_9BACL|nr:3'-5' exonuclease [Paenibacillus azoreducens]GIO51210.1 helicase [Paenibacillus azoreducens]